MVVVNSKDKHSFTRLSTEETTREAARRRLFSKEAKNTIYVDGAHMLNAPTKQYLLSWIKFLSLSIILLSFIVNENKNQNHIFTLACFNYGLFCLSLLTYILMMYKRFHVDEESDLVGNITFISLKLQKEFYIFLLSSQLWISIWYFYVFDNKPKNCGSIISETTNDYVKEKLTKFVCDFTTPTYYVIIGTIIISLYQIGSFVIFKRF
uniref:Transmembrane protein n=1 Tax=Strongyloides venezuelensis TaxID=75913 RepID=A0A0K0F6P0_STRVS